VEGCRRTNCKFSDSEFDIEEDFRRGRRNCLDSLVIAPGDGPSPKSIKRVRDIFEDPEFNVDGATSNDVRQGALGNYWLLAAIAAMGSKPDLIQKVCIDRDEEIGVYGFVFVRDGEWVAEIIDDKLYLKHPDFDESKGGGPGYFERNVERKIKEENYRKMYQVLIEFRWTVQF
jgi:Calpain family cysteine protease